MFKCNPKDIANNLEEQLTNVYGLWTEVLMTVSTRDTHDQDGNAYENLPKNSAKAR